ncbi:MAG: N-acetylglucosamine-6-phosphate deacetylase [Butyrivibrio sp.]|nr:N-acetylglucosamine-6-phosphate deacetylase [Butyrivibrio sp.]
MKITNALVFGADQTFVKRDIDIRDGKFADACDPSDEVFDASGYYAIPGLVDIHFHGAMGSDVCDGGFDDFVKIAEYELSRGVTAICPATLTLPVETLKNVLATGAEFAKEDRPDCSELVGFNMEGPFISRAKKGAQNEEFIINCDPSIVDGFVEASNGLLKIIGIAPECNEGFEEYIKAVKDKVTVSLAHTAADYDFAKRAINAGACHAVHLYNAMTGMDHRNPGVVGAVFDSDNVTAELICDNIHIHPAVVRNTFKIMGKDRMILISDSMRATGMPDGEYDLGGMLVEKKGRECRLKEGGSIAGSGSDLMDCLTIAVKTMGIPIEEAVAAATVNPARRIGIDDLHGEIAVGKYADLVLLDRQSLELKAVFKRGKRVV